LQLACCPRLPKTTGRSSAPALEHSFAEVVVSLLAEGAFGVEGLLPSSFKSCGLRSCVLKFQGIEMPPEPHTS